MPSDLDAIVNDLLARWHRWRTTYQHTRGYPASDATCRGFSAPNHWDWLNGAADERADELLVQAVDNAVDRVPNTPQPWNLALQFEARNLASRAKVWTSPRLPRDAGELQVLRLEARNRLLIELQRSGVLGC